MTIYIGIRWFWEVDYENEKINHIGKILLSSLEHPKVVL
jgi:hypothetical protein